MIDARGYGRSDKPHDPNLYAIDSKAGDTIAVMDALKLDRAYCFGYSMGGRTTFTLMKYFPARFTAFIIGGAHPYGSNNLLDSLRKQLPKGMTSLVEQTEKVLGPFPEKVRENY